MSKTRPNFTSKIVYETLGIESGEETEEDEASVSAPEEECVAAHLAGTRSNFSFFIVPLFFFFPIFGFFSLVVWSFELFYGTLIDG